MFGAGPCVSKIRTSICFITQYILNDLKKQRQGLCNTKARTQNMSHCDCMSALDKGGDCKLQVSASVVLENATCEERVEAHPSLHHIPWPMSTETRPSGIEAPEPVDVHWYACASSFSLGGTLSLSLAQLSVSEKMRRPEATKQHRKSGQCLSGVCRSLCNDCHALGHIKG